MLLLTTLDAWRTRTEERFVLGDDSAWAPDEKSALAIADEMFAGGGQSGEQAIVLTLDPVPPPAGVIDRGQVAEVRYARRSPEGRHVALLRRPPVADSLDLLPHPEGGWYRETWATRPRFTPPGYPGERVSATGIYFLLPPGEESVWHLVRSDEMWFWHRGGPLTLLLGGDGGSPARTGDDGLRTVTLGPGVERGQRPQALVPAGVWQAARPAADEEVLVSCVVSPGFDFADFRVV
ncbi:cupin domain-containing protein [Actinomadura scrupuli]|uniref:cupin domain-containing protein n=1 Tax=Actinomadura scrupuli TaxID=559629 RepID=UPI003D958D03